VVADGTMDALTVTSSATITGSTIGHMTVSGVSPTISGNTFTDDIPLRITDPDVAFGGFSGNVYTAADPGARIGGALEGDQTLGFVDGVVGSYTLSSSLTVAAGATLSLAPGVRVASEHYSHHVYVDGRLEGTGASLGLLSKRSGYDQRSTVLVGGGGELSLSGGTV